MSEIWKDIEGYEGLYQISINGNVRCFRIKKNKPHLIKKQKTQQGYYAVELRSKEGKRKLYLVHRLIAQAFIPNPNNFPIINHIDANKLNNKIENLEWCTYSHNNKEAYRLNLKTNGFLGKTGKENIHSKPVYQIDKKDNHIINKFCSQKEAADFTKINKSNINSVCKGHRNTAGGFIWRFI